MTPAQNSFQTQLKFARSVMTKAQRRRTRNRPLKPIVYPIGIERQYYKQIKNITQTYIDLCKPFVQKYIGTYFVRKDSVEDDLDILMDEMMR